MQSICTDGLLIIQNNENEPLMGEVRYIWCFDHSKDVGIDGKILEWVLGKYILYSVKPLLFVFCIFLWEGTSPFQTLLYIVKHVSKWNSVIWKALLVFC